MSVPSPSHITSRAHTPMGEWFSKNSSPTTEENGAKDESHSVDPHPQDVCKPQSIAQPPPEPSPDTPQGKRKLLLHYTHYLISVLGRVCACCSVCVVCCTGGGGVGGGVELICTTVRNVLFQEGNPLSSVLSFFSHSCSPNGSPNGRQTIAERLFKATWWDVW